MEFGKGTAPLTDCPPWKVVADVQGSLRACDALRGHLWGALSSWACPGTPNGAFHRERQKEEG